MTVTSASNNGNPIPSPIAMAPPSDTAFPVARAGVLSEVQAAVDVTDAVTVTLFVVVADGSARSERSASLSSIRAFGTVKLTVPCVQITQENSPPPHGHRSDLDPETVPLHPSQRLFSFAVCNERC
jgi:hypothetical protein